MSPRVPDVNTPAGRAWSTLSVDNKIIGILPESARANFSLDLPNENKFNIISGLAKETPAFRIELNKKLADIKIDGKKYEFDAEGNIVEKTDSQDIVPEVNAAKTTVPNLSDVTSEKANAGIPSLKTKLQKISNELGEIDTPEAKKLKANIDKILQGDNISSLSKNDLDKLKEIISNAEGTTKTTLGKVSTMLGNNKTFIALFGAYLCYEGYNRRKKRAEENRRKCMAQCKPIAFDAWSMGALTTEQLIDPPVNNQNTANCGETCWNTEGNNADYFCTATMSPDTTPQLCEEYCTTKCDEKYPDPDITEIFSSENLFDGVEELGENGIDAGLNLTEDFFTKFWDFLPDDIIAKVFSVIGIIIGLVIFVFLVSFIRSRKAQKNVST